MERYLRNSILAAFLLWFAMFSPWTRDDVNFWGLMVSAAVLLSAASFWYGRDLWRERWHYWRTMSGTQALRFWGSQLLLGVGLAVLLWGVFYVGDKLSQWIFPSFARMQVDAVYGIKGDWNPRLLAWLLLLVIGPAEELFWRGYVQESFTRDYQVSSSPGVARHASLVAMLVSTAIYTLIHLPSFNFMLIMAALVCGVVWGWLYYWRPQWLPAIVLSHALWDAAVFVWFPL